MWTQRTQMCSSLTQGHFVTVWLTGSPTSHSQVSWRYRSESFLSGVSFGLWESWVPRRLNAQIPFSDNLAAEWASNLSLGQTSQIRGDDGYDSYAVPALTSMLEQIWNLWQWLRMMIWCWHSSEIHKETFKLELRWGGFAALSILQSRTAAGIQNPSYLW